MVYLTGDTHGELDRFKHGRLRWLGKRDIVVVLGDFGFVWDGSKEEQKKLDWLRKRPYTLLFLDGAHENYDLLAQYPVEERFGGRVQALGGNVYHVCRGSVLELEGKKNVRLIVNRVDEEMLSTVRLTIDDIMDTTGTPLAGVVPEDPNITLAAAFGVPVLAYARRCPAARAFRRIADRLEGITAPIKL